MDKVILNENDIILNENDIIEEQEGLAIEKLVKLAKQDAGRRRARVCREREAREFLRVFKKVCRDEKTKEIRVYSFDGFVAHAYGYPSKIQYFHATRTDGAWKISVKNASASRPYGLSPLITVNNRAYEE